MNIEIIAAESLGVRGLCCRVDLPGRRIVIDPGVALGYRRSGLLPHPVQVAAGRWVRRAIVSRLATATDVILSHYHGDHVPLADANPYQLSIQDLPPEFSALRVWSPSPRILSGTVRRRFDELNRRCEKNLCIAEGRTEGPLSFSTAVAHGRPSSHLGSVMMTRIDTGSGIFVHASDIQLLHPTAIDIILAWQPDIVLAGGPPLYLDTLGPGERLSAWENAQRLARAVPILVIDHHLMRSLEGAGWLAALSARTGGRVHCAADFMRRPRRLLEAERARWYRQRPVPPDWHRRYEKSAPAIASDPGDDF